MRNMVFALLALALLVVACAPTPTGEAVNNETNTTETAPQLPAAPDVPAAPDPVNETLPGARFTVEGTEGDLIQLKPEAIDPDGDSLTFTFTKPFDKDGNWQTAIGDEGTHDVVVGVSDGKSTTTETVRVIVHRANRAPTIVCKTITVNEGEIVDLHKDCTVADEDDEKVLVTYSGWMAGWRYTTSYEDAGTHTVTITASDENHTVSQDVTVTVQNTNRPPVFSDDFPALITATENDVITLPSDLITDPDKDPVTVTYSAPFTKGVWKTKIGDAGTYDVDVVASDGQMTVKKTVTIKVGLLNTAPTLRTIPDITVREGETIKLPVSATDREGDKLTTTISGWMTSDTYKTTYDDAGNYTVKVTVTDGEFTASQTVHITVIDVNRPPVFVTPA